MSPSPESDPRVGINGAVAEVLNGERVAAGLSFDQLAAISRLNVQTVKRYLSPKMGERRHLDIAKIADLGGIFGLTTGQVVEMAEKRMAREASMVPAAHAEDAKRAIKAAMPPTRKSAEAPPRRKRRTG